MQYVCVCVYTDTWAAHARLSVPEPRLAPGPLESPSASSCSSSSAPCRRIAAVSFSAMDPWKSRVSAACAAPRLQLVVGEGSSSGAGGRLPCRLHASSSFVMVWRQWVQVRIGLKSMRPATYHAPSHVATAIPGAATWKGHAVHLAFNSSLAAGTCFWVTVHTHVWFKLKYTRQTCA